MLRLFLLLFPCLALAQYPKAMDFSKLYQGKLDSVAVIHRTGWTKETSWPEAPEEERITELSEMLEGKNSGVSARNHAIELLKKG